MYLESPNGHPYSILETNEVVKRQQSVTPAAATPFSSGQVRLPLTMTRSPACFQADTIRSLSSLYVDVQWRSHHPDRQVLKVEPVNGVCVTIKLDIREPHIVKD